MVNTWQNFSRLLDHSDDKITAGRIRAALNAIKKSKIDPENVQFGVFSFIQNTCRLSGSTTEGSRKDCLNSLLTALLKHRGRSKDNTFNVMLCQLTIE